jgi:hypothetical protein
VVKASGGAVASVSKVATQAVGTAVVSTAKVATQAVGIAVVGAAKIGTQAVGVAAIGAAKVGFKAAGLVTGGVSTIGALAIKTGSSAIKIGSAKTMKAVDIAVRFVIEAANRGLFNVFNIGRGSNFGGQTGKAGGGIAAHFGDGLRGVGKTFGDFFQKPFVRNTAKVFVGGAAVAGVIYFGGANIYLVPSVEDSTANLRKNNNVTKLKQTNIENTGGSQSGSGNPDPDGNDPKDGNKNRQKLYDGVDGNLPKTFSNKSSAKLGESRIFPETLEEQVAMAELRLNPDPTPGKNYGFTELKDVIMSDAKNGWLAKDGWIKISKNFKFLNANGRWVKIEIHYLWNNFLHVADDFKFIIK